jgi:tRNA A37 threonylcarbamoyladenosine biosynthesis protein TsaE
MAGQLSEAAAGNDTVIVEWADIVKDVLPPERITVEFKPTAASPDERQITITYPESSREIITYLESTYSEEKP